MNPCDDYDQARARIAELEARMIEISKTMRFADLAAMDYVRQILTLQQQNARLRERAEELETLDDLMTNQAAEYLERTEHAESKAERLYAENAELIEAAERFEALQSNVPCVLVREGVAFLNYAWFVDGPARRSMPLAELADRMRSKP